MPSSPERTRRATTARRTLLSRQAREIREARRQARTSGSRARPEESELPIVEAFSEAGESELSYVETSSEEIEELQELERERVTVPQPLREARAETQIAMQGDNTDLVSGVAQLFEHLQTSGGTTAGGTPPPLQQHDPLGAGLVGAESSDDQNSSASLPEGQRFNTVPSVLYASAPGQGGVFFYTPSKATSLPGSPTPIPPLFTTPPVRSRPLTRSVKRRAAASSPKASQPSAGPFVPLRTMTAAAGLPGYHPWPHVYPGTGVPVIGSPDMAPVTAVSGFPALTFPTVPTPLPTIGGGGGGGSGGRGFGQTSLPVPRQDFTQAVNAARSVNKFKGDGVTKPDHHLKNFEAVMQAVGILDQDLWITVFKTTLVDEATSFAYDLDEEGVTKWPKLKEKFITRYRGAINPVMVMDNLAKVQHKKGEPVLAYVNRFRMEAKWLLPEEANSPMVASLFLKNMQPHINDPCCLQFQPGNCTMDSDSHGARDCRLKGRRAPTMKAVEPGPPKLSRQFRSASFVTSPAIPSIKDARNTHRSLQVTGTNVDQLGKTGTVFAGQPPGAKR
ncbi:hypothetical protein R1flu_024913 [Riccia fluitans]|uniref:Retrotransposon gag domain-containing protein n=1 Tax=Riccia fluitans TaxID=41844 RepID=A0ABD1XW97_9MARC